MWDKYTFRPSVLKTLPDSECTTHKYFIVLCGAGMGITALGMMGFHSNVVYRAWQLQESAWANERFFHSEYENMEQYDDAYFDMKNDLGVLTEKTVRDLAYIKEGWVDRIYLPVGGSST
jgi:hypothetical protein